jgi:NitT/TauT family transport system ATP-binding protein
VKTRLQIVHPGKQPAPARNILEVERLSKSFAINGSGKITVLQDIGFKVRRGEFLCILGRSGCGKSTLLKILAGFMQPSTGAVRINGRPAARPGPDRCVVFQEDALFGWLTVRENIAFGLRGRGITRREKERDVDRFLSLVGLTDFGNYLPAEISGGMKQRVALARVLILQPEVLLMDEPFAALDAQTREEMQDLLLRLWSELAHTIVFVTHDVGEAALLADRILLFDHAPGRIKEEFQIALLRPRQKEDDGYYALCRSITAKIKAL